MSLREKRALYVLNSFRNGGAEIGLATLLEQGFMQGVDFRILAFAQGDALLRKRISDLVGQDKVIVVCENEKLTVKSLALGCFVLFQTIRRFSPSVVVLSLKQANLVGRFVLSFFLSIHCVAFEHSARLDEKRFAPFYKILLRFLSYRVDETWADCQTTLRETETLYFWGQKRLKQVIPLFCCSGEKKEKKAYAAPETFRIVMAGRLISSKRHDLVLRALPALLKEGKNLSLTIMGTGPHEAQLKQIVKELQIGDRVFFKGHVHSWWRQAADFDLFVHPSEREGFCIVAAEAMMMGLPVLATPVGGLRDYTTNGVDAIHLSENTAEAIGKEIQNLYEDEALRRRIGENAAQNIQARYNTTSIKQDLSALTERLFY